MQDRQDDFPRGAGVGRALQDHELPGPQHGGDLFGRLLDIRQVRVAGFVQRRGHADQQGIGLAQPPHVGRGHEAPVSHAAADPLRGNMLDIAVAGQKLIDLGPIDVEPHRAESGRDKGPDQGQADIAQSNNANLGRLALNGLFERGNAHER